jgi:hypothetical protein
MSSIQKLFTSRDNNANSATYVGQQDRIWYDSTLGFRVSNGNTPGGTPAVVATTSANIGNLVIFDTTISTIQADANLNLVTNGTGNINITGAFVTANTAGSKIIETLQNGTINFYVSTISNDSAIDIIGTADGNQVYPQNQGVLLHLTGQDSLPARIYSDGVNNYAAFIGRRYNGSPTAPTQVLAGQTISRYGGTPYGSTGWPVISTARVDFMALEDQTDSNKGTSIEFYTTPVGTASAVPSMTIASTGITNSANIVPVSDQGYNLGTPDLRWKNVYAGQGGLWMADNTTNAEVQLSVNAGTFFINGVQNIALGNLVINNTTLETATPNTNIYIGNVADTGYLQIDRTTQIVTQNLGNSAALLINGSLSNIVPTEYTNTLFHTINVPGYDSVTLYDNFGGATNTFSGVQGRSARGTIQAPTNTQANDVLFQLSGTGYGNGFDTALGTQGGSRIDFRATETFTGSAKGSDIHFWTTQPGTTSTVNSGSINYQGFFGNSFTFTTDNSIQTSAGIPLTQKANALGVATLDSNGYLTAAEIPPSLLGGVQYIGSWDAANNTPTLSNGTGNAGYEYSIGVTGTQNLGGGSVTYQQGGFVIYGSNVWNYIPPSSIFTSLTASTHLSVNQPTGAITISVDATPSLVNSTIVSRDANGSFAANVITATLSGAATSAGTAGTVTNSVQTAITQVGTLTALTVSGNVNSGNLRTTGLISATGNVTSNYFIGNGSLLTSLTGANVSGTVANATYATSSGSATSATTAATVTTAAQPNITSVGILTSLSSSGNITASYFLGNGSQLTGIVSSYGNSNVNTLLSAWGSNTLSTTGTITAGNITGAYLIGTNIIGTLTTASQTNITSIGTLGALTVSGNISAGNINSNTFGTHTGAVTGNVTGNLTGTVLTAAQTSITSVGTLTGLSVSGNVTSGNISATNHTGTTVSVTGAVTSASVVGGVITGTSTSATGNITGGNLATGGTASATGNITGGNLATGGTASATGNITGGNVLTGGQVSATGNITGGNVLTGGLVSATGNITGGNVLTGGQVSATANITGGNLLTGGLISATSTITSVANITGGNVLTGGLVSATGNITGGNLLTGGLISATSTITSVANITGGNVLTGGQVSATANITGGNVLTGGLVSATGAITSAANITGGNVLTGGQVSATANITGGNVSTAGQVSATGNISGGNLNIASSGTITTPRMVFNYGGIRQLTGNTTVTLDFTTDSMVSLTNPTNTVTITLANYTAGAIVRFIYSSATARNINMGVAAAVNSTTGTANITGTGGGALYGANQSVILTYYCVGGTAATTYVSASYV